MRGADSLILEVEYSLALLPVALLSLHLREPCSSCKLEALHVHCNGDKSGHGQHILGCMVSKYWGARSAHTGVHGQHILGCTVSTYRGTWSAHTGVHGHALHM